MRTYADSEDPQMKCRIMRHSISGLHRYLRQKKIFRQSNTIFILKLHPRPLDIHNEPSQIVLYQVRRKYP